jgi:hypothetical protein
LEFYGGELVLRQVEDGALESRLWQAFDLPRFTATGDALALDDAPAAAEERFLEFDGWLSPGEVERRLDVGLREALVQGEQEQGATSRGAQAAEER